MMRCGKCGQFVYQTETGSMGSEHSNFYECYHCGAIYLIEDRYRSDVARDCDLVKNNLSEQSMIYKEEGTSK